MKQISRLLILFAFCLLLLQCKKEKQPEPTLPDYSGQGIKIEVKAGERWFETDLVGHLSVVRFSSVLHADSYYWVLDGTSSRKPTFSNTWIPENQWFTVKLVTYRNATQQYDTFESKFYCVKGYSAFIDSFDFELKKQFPIFGRFKGSYNNKPDETIIVSIIDTFRTQENPQDEPSFGYWINIPWKGFDSRFCKRCEVYDFFKGYCNPTCGYIDSYEAWYDYKVRFYPHFKGYAWLDRNDKNKINIELNYKDSLGNNIQTVFKGNRIL